MIKKMQFCLIKKYKMTRITVAEGDGIGPEIMDATLKIIVAAGAQIEIDEIPVGEKVFSRKYQWYCSKLLGYHPQK